MNDKQKVLIRKCLWLFCLIVFLYLVIAIPCITQIAWKDNTIIYRVDNDGKAMLGNLSDYGQCVIAIMVLVPILVVVIALLLSETYFKVITEQMVENDYKKHMRYGYLDNERFIDNVLYLKNKSLENKKTIQENKLKRAQLEIELKKMEEKSKKEAIEQLKNIEQKSTNIQKETIIEKKVEENPKMY